MILEKKVTSDPLSACSADSDLNLNTTASSGEDVAKKKSKLLVGTPFVMVNSNIMLDKNDDFIDILFKYFLSEKKKKKGSKLSESLDQSESQSQEESGDEKLELSGSFDEGQVLTS